MTELRTVREQKGHTLRQAAKILGVSAGYLCRIENGEKSPGLALSVAIQSYSDGQIRPEDFIATPATCEPVASLSTPVAEAG